MQAPGPGHFSVGGSPSSEMGFFRRPSWSGVEQAPVPEQFGCTFPLVPTVSCSASDEQRGFAEEDA